jgi:hypothetical protein
MRHALQVGEWLDDGVIVNVNPVTAQRIADLDWQLDLDPRTWEPVNPDCMGQRDANMQATERCIERALLPTTRIIDCAWKVAVARDSDLPPFPQSPGTSTVKMAENSSSVVRETLSRGARAREEGIFGVNAGKHFPLTNKTLGKVRVLENGEKLQLVANYGWFGGKWTTASGLKAWQSLGTKHGINFTDYSQIVWLVHSLMILDGKFAYLTDVVTDPELSALVSDEGPLRTTRLAGTVVPVDQRDTEPPPAPATLPAPPKVPSMQLKVDQSVQAVWKEKYGAAITTELRRFGSRAVGQVKAWQQYVRVDADDDFGKLTEAATKEMQGRVGLPVTGVVDLATLLAATAELREQLKAPDGRAETAWIPAKNFTKASRRPGDVHWLVIHTMEAAEKPTTAEAVAHWFGGASAPKASAHYCIDNDSVVRCVRLEDVAWAAPGANRYGIQYELAGYAKQAPTDWDDPFSVSMLALAAVQLAMDSVRFDVPIRRITVDELKQARALYSVGKPVPRELWGICGHHDTSQAWKLSSHYDPGPNFPWVTFIEQVNEIKRKLLSEP